MKDRDMVPMMLYVIGIIVALLWVLGNIVIHGPLTVWGMDFRGYYASARIAVRDGFHRIYDENLQKEVQQGIMRSLSLRSNPEDYPSALTPYLPVFILILFVPFSVFSPLLAFVIWSSLNLGIGILYLRYRWASNLGWDKVLIAMASYPALTNLFWGQPTVFMMIGMAEALIALREGRSGRAGLWLSVLLIKPQALFLILPGLALVGQWRALLAFTGGAFILLGFSVVLLGRAGIAGYMELLREASIAPAGHPSFHPEVQMNWRALSLALQPWSPDWMRWGVAGALFALSVIGALSLWRIRGSDEPFIWSLRLLGTSAATGAAAWHAHTHQAMILLPMLLDLFRHNQLSSSLFAVWAFTPWLATGAGLFLALIYPQLSHPEAILPGQTLLLWNIYFVFYAILKLKSKSK